MNGKWLFNETGSLYDYVLGEIRYGNGEKVADVETIVHRLTQLHAKLIDFLADKEVIQQEDLKKVLWEWNSFEMEKDSEKS